MSCKGCYFRTTGCHMYCEEYIEWVENHRKEKEKIRKNKKRESEYTSYKTERVHKSKKRGK